MFSDANFIEALSLRGCARACSMALSPAVSGGWGGWVLFCPAVAMSAFGLRLFGEEAYAPRPLCVEGSLVWGYRFK